MFTPSQSIFTSKALLLFGLSEPLFCSAKCNTHHGVFRHYGVRITSIRSKPTGTFFSPVHNFLLKIKAYCKTSFQIQHLGWKMYPERSPFTSELCVLALEVFFQPSSGKEISFSNYELINLMLYFTELAPTRTLSSTKSRPYKNRKGWGTIRKGKMEKLPQTVTSRYVTRIVTILMLLWQGKEHSSAVPEKRQHVFISRPPY